MSRLKGDHTGGSVIDAVDREALSYLGRSALGQLNEVATELEARKVPGVFVEAGCALGGSAIVIANAKRRARPLYVYDVFSMIPPPTSADGDDVHARYERIRSGQSEGIRGHRYYGYEEDLYGIVKSNFARLGRPVDRHNVHLVKGLFQDTIRLTEPVALAHIDGDWYESVRTCLERLVPLLVQHGVLVIDDYDAWSGCRRAVDEYFADKKDAFTFRKRARLHIIKQ